MRVHQLIILAQVHYLIIGRCDQAQPGLLRFSGGLGPVLGLKHREGERTGSERRIFERAPEDVRVIGQLHDAGAAVRRPPLREYRNQHRIMQIVITSYFFLKFPVVVVEIVEKLRDVLCDVKGWGFDIEVDRLMFGPWCGRFGNSVAGLGLGLGLCHHRACRERNRDQRHRDPDGSSSAYYPRKKVK